MADLTNAKIANTYKDLLQVNAETSNAGLDGTVRTIQDGGGTASPIAMSTAQLNVTGQFALAGTVLTATADQLNDLAVGKLDTLTAGDDTVKLTIAGVSVSTATVSATVVVNPVLSLTEVDAATGSFNTKVSATNFVAGTGSFTTKVSGVAAEFSGNVSAANVYASTNIFVAGESIPSAITSVNAVIAAVSALTSVNKAAITSINAGPASTFDALSVKTTITVGPDTGGNKNINILSSDAIASLEIGGETAAFIDLKTPRSDDFDLRLGSSGTGGYIRPSEGASLSIIGSSETLATFTDDGSVALYHNNVKKLETAADGVDIDDINLGGKVLTITGDTGDTFTITTGAAGETTLATTDAAGTDGKIILDADGLIVIDSGSGTGGGDVHFKAGGTHYATINKSGDHAYFVNQISDGNINLRGNDGGSFINALTLDMSEAGLATFNDGATFNGDVTLTGAANNVVWDKSDNAMEFGDNAKAVFGFGYDMQVYHDGNDSYIKDSGTGDLNIQTVGSAIILHDTAAGNLIYADAAAVRLYHAGVTKLTTTAAGATISGGLTADSATVDDISLDGKVLTITGDTNDTFTITSGANGATTLRAIDTAGELGTLTLDADGRIFLDAGDAYGGIYFEKDSTSYAAVFTAGTVVGFQNLIDNGSLKFQGYDSGSTITALDLQMGNAGKAVFNAGATFADDVTVEDINLSGKVLTITGDTSDTFTITAGASGFTTIATTDAAGADGHLLLDIDGAIILDAGDASGQVQVKTAGTEYLRIYNSGSNAYIKPVVSDGDFIIQGNDGGSNITALRLDMSDAGAAYFNYGVNTTWHNDNYFRMYYDDSYHMGLWMEADTRDLILYTKSADGAGDIRFQTGSAPTERMTILANGNVGIGNTSPTSTLHVTGDATVDDINLNGKVLTITGDTGDTFTITAGTNGATTLRTIDAAGADAYLSLFADGVIELNSGSTYGSILLDHSGTNYGEFFTGGTSFNIRNNINDGDVILAGKDGSSYINALTLDMSEAGKAIFNAGATFADDVTVEDINLSGKVLTITGDTSDTFTITTGAAGATTLATTDAAGADGRLIFSADGMIDYSAGDTYGQHRFFGGSMFMTILPGSGNSGADAAIRNNTSDGDLIFRGNDGGSYITALTLDMSEAGAATFNAGATLGGGLTIAGGGSRTASGQTENIIITNSNSTGDDTGIHMTAGNTGKSTIRFGAPGDDTLAQIFAQNDTTTATLKFAAGNSNTNLVLSGPSGSETAEFTGKVGIGITAPLKTLHVDGPALSTVQTLTDASTVTSDFDVGQNFTLTLAGNRTLGAPSNVDAGQVGSIFIIQDGTGSRTLAYNSIWKFAGGTAPTLSTAAGAIDRLDYIVQSGTAIQAVLTKAYA